MCWFIEIGIDASFVEVPADVGLRFGITVREIGPDRRSKFFPAGLSTYGVTRGGCSCELYKENGASKPLMSEPLRAKLAKGWSDAKIERAVKSSSDAKTQSALKMSGGNVDFAKMMETIVRGSAAAYVFAHFYSGSEQPPSPETSLNLALDSFLDKGFPADTLVRLRSN